MGKFDDRDAVEQAAEVPIVTELPAHASNETSGTVTPEVDQGSFYTDAGPVLLVPVILAVLALVAVSRRKETGK